MSPRRRIDEQSLIAVGECAYRSARIRLQALQPEGGRIGVLKSVSAVIFKWDQRFESAFPQRRVSDDTENSYDRFIIGDKAWVRRRSHGITVVSLGVSYACLGYRTREQRRQSGVLCH
jgi:hypothetical protein